MKLKDLSKDQKFRFVHGPVKTKHKLLHVERNRLVQVQDLAKMTKYWIDVSKENPEVTVVSF